MATDNKSWMQSSARTLLASQRMIGGMIWCSCSDGGYVYDGDSDVRWLVADDRRRKTREEGVGFSVFGWWPATTDFMVVPSLVLTTQSIAGMLVVDVHFLMVLEEVNGVRVAHTQA